MSKRECRHWMPDEDARLKALVGTMDVSEIGRELGRSRRGVIQRGVFLRIPVGFKRTPVCRQKRDEISAMLAAGDSVPKIADALGINYYTLWGRVRKMGAIPLVDGRRSKIGAAGRRHGTVKREKKSPAKIQPKIEVSRLARCECGLWVVNTLEGWARHRACVHGKKAS